VFLSKLVLNLRNRSACHDLARPYELHRTLLTRGFGARPKAEVGRLLYRVDSDRAERPVVLVKSDVVPSWDLPAGYLLGPAETKPFDLTVAIGQRLRFRLRANPTKRVAEKNPRLGSVMAGKRVGLVTDAERVAWLIRKAEPSGFAIPGEWFEGTHPVTGAAEPVPNFRVDVIPEGRARNDKTGFRDGAFVAVRFEGVLVVTDPLRFVGAVRAGIGSAKGFGFGLLSVAPA